jgi:thiol-disulfide isomerase/thioredoxin
LKTMRTFLITTFLITALFGAGELSNRRAPGFSLMDLRSVQHDPQDDRGKVVIVEFMQTTCPHCQKFSTILEQAKAKYKDQIVIYSIVTNPDTFQTMQKYSADYKLSSPILFDSGQVMASYMKLSPSNPTMNFPHLFLIDKNGMIRNDYGYVEKTASVFETTGPLFAELDKMVSGK